MSEDERQSQREAIRDYIAKEVRDIEGYPPDRVALVVLLEQLYERDDVELAMGITFLVGLAHFGEHDYAKKWLLHQLKLAAGRSITLLDIQ